MYLGCNLTSQDEKISEMQAFSHISCPSLSTLASPSTFRHQWEPPSVFLPYLRDSQVLGPCDPRQVSLCGEDFPDSQLWKDTLQFVVSGDGELGQGEFVNYAENGKRNVRVTELCVPLKPHCSWDSSPQTAFSLERSPLPIPVYNP